MNISKHAQQRYAERIMEKDDKTDIAVFINEHQEKISEDINKMIEYGEEIYQGKANGKDEAIVVAKDAWIILITKERDNVITLYKIDFGLDEDFNKEYVTKMREKLLKAQEKAEEEKKKIEENVEEYRGIIETNKETIAKHNRINKSLSEQNEMYQGIINSMKANVEIAEEEVRVIVEKLIGRK